MKFTIDTASCVVALQENGRYHLREVPAARRSVAPGSIESAWFWQVESTPVLPKSVGAPVTASTFPLPGGAKFGLVSLPSGSEGKMRAAAEDLSAGMTANDRSTGMHATRSVDFEIVVSGKLVVELPGGSSRVLEAGDCIVMCGVPHRWSNPFDEPCVYAAVVLGAADVV